MGLLGECWFWSGRKVEKLLSNGEFLGNKPASRRSNCPNSYRRRGHLLFVSSPPAHCRQCWQKPFQILHIHSIIHQLKLLLNWSCWSTVYAPLPVVQSDKSLVGYDLNYLPPAHPPIDFLKMKFFQDRVLFPVHLTTYPSHTCCPWSPLLAITEAICQGPAHCPR